MQCLVPPGIGTGYSITVTARGIFGSAGGFLFSYLPPSDVVVEPSLLPTTGGVVAITGANFGAGMTGNETDTLAQWLTASGRAVTIDGVACQVSLWTSTRIVCLAPEGVAALPRLAISVGGQSNVVQTGLVAYMPPRLTSFLTPPSRGSEGGIVAFFTGANLGPATANLTVYFNRVDAPVRYACNVTQHDHVSGFCVVPPGAGAGLAVTVETTGRSPEPVPLEPTVTYSYDPPVVVSVEPVVPAAGRPTVGGFVVQLRGSSLTLESQVTVSGLPCAVVPGTRTHVSVNCTVPANFGVQHPLVVTAAGQTNPPFFFSYDGPVVTEVRPLVEVNGLEGVLAPPGGGARFNAKHGTDVVITGYNFGATDTRHGVVTLNGSECRSALFVRDYEIRCTLPPDQTVGLAPLVVATWNPITVNESQDDLWQRSLPFAVRVQCPLEYFGRVNEVGCPRAGPASAVTTAPPPPTPARVPHAAAICVAGPACSASTPPPTPHIHTHFPPPAVSSLTADLLGVPHCCSVLWWRTGAVRGARVL